MKFREWFKKNRRNIIIIWSILTAVLLIICIASERRVYRNNTYTDIRYVTLYLKKYHELPKNYITYYGREYYQNHSIPTDGLSVGGDTHYNDRRLSNFGVSNNELLKECDIYDEGFSITNRGTHRLVYTVNTTKVRVFETTDHYTTYNREITKFAIMPFHYIMIICTIIHFIASGVIVWIIYKPYFTMFNKIKEDTIDVDVIEEN